MGSCRFEDFFGSTDAPKEAQLTWGAFLLGVLIYKLPFWEPAQTLQMELSGNCQQPRVDAKSGRKLSYFWVFLGGSHLDKDRKLMQTYSHLFPSLNPQCSHFQQFTHIILFRIGLVEPSTPSSHFP